MRVASKHGPLKRGDKREGGAIFWAYLRGIEVWCAPDVFNSRVQNSRRLAREYHWRHRERVLKKLKSYFKKNKAETAIKKREYRQRNKDKINEYMRDYGKRNRHRTNSYSRKYKEKNTEKVRARLRDYMKRRRKTDHVFGLACLMRSRIGSMLRSLGCVKDSTSVDAVGCSWAEFKSHIEKQFTEGMGWHNRGEWHIDHIAPLALAKTKEDVIRLSHFTNLRPMWAIDNMKKGAKVLCER